MGGGGAGGRARARAQDACGPWHQDGSGGATRRARGPWRARPARGMSGGGRPPQTPPQAWDDGGEAIPVVATSDSKSPASATAQADGAEELVALRRVTYEDVNATTGTLDFRVKLSYAMPAVRGPRCAPQPARKSGRA